MNRRARDSDDGLSGVRNVAFVGYNTAGCWTALQIGLARRGIQSDIIASEDHPFHYGNSIRLPPLRTRVLQGVEHSLEHISNFWIARLTGQVVTSLLLNLKSHVKERGRISLLRWLARNYDLVFAERGSRVGKKSGDETIFSEAKSRLVFVAFGSDMRASMLDGAAFPAGKPLDFFRMKSQVNAKSARGVHLDGGGVRTIATPGTSYYFSRPIIDRDMLGFPIVPTSKTVARASRSGPVTILHAPSNPAAKGSGAVEAAVRALESQTQIVSLRLLHKVARDVVMKGLEESDIVIDQLYSDQYAGVFAREALSLGVPVIIGSYDAAWLKQHYADRIPYGLQLIEPHEFENTLRNMVENVDFWRSERDRIGASFHAMDNLDLVTGRWLRAALGDVEEEWLFDPNDLPVALGGFCGHEHRQALICGWVDRFGADDFGFSGKEQLRTAILRAGGLEAR